ncbi:unnamed protein product, partial [Closterium sp. NIES-54]
EVRMPAAGRKDGPLNQSELKDDTKQAREERQFVQHALASPPFCLYRVWWSLAPTKYASTAMLLKRSLLPHLLSASFSLDASGSSREEKTARGRWEGSHPGVSIPPSSQHLCAKHFLGASKVVSSTPTCQTFLRRLKSRLLDTYVPKIFEAPQKSSPQHLRAKQRLLQRLSQLSPPHRVGRTHPSVSHQRRHAIQAIHLAGRSQCESNDDVSDPEFFRTVTNGEPATDPRDQGQPGFSVNERMRFAETLKRAGLTDVYRHMHATRAGLTAH